MGPSVDASWHRGLLGKTAQRVLKVLHLLFAGIWLGSIVCMLALLAAGDAGSVLAAHAIHDVILFAAFTGTLVTGLTFSLFTRWGFFVHDWISAKWLLAFALFAITLGWQSASLSGLAALSDAGLAEIHGYRREAFHAAALRQVVAQLCIVVAVYFVSTLKPWGTRKPPEPNRRVLVTGVVGLALLGAGFGLFNHQRLEALRNVEVADVRPTGLADGSYRGRAHCDFTYEVQARVESGKLVGLVAVQNRDNHYARIAEAVLARIQRAQTTRVDAITGATTTSKCLMRAAQDALSAR